MTAKEKLVKIKKILRQLDVLATKQNARRLNRLFKLLP